VIVVNGQERDDLRAGITVAELLQALDAPQRGVAVAIDAEVIPRGEWEGTEIPEGARVEVLTAVQGG
jgi:sulfur carrier protein